MADTPKTSNSEPVAEKQAQPPKKPKQGLFKRAGKGIQTWVSWDAIKTNSGYVKENTRSLFVIQKPEHTETFEEAMKRLNLTEADIEVRKSAFLRLAIIIGACGIFALLYTLYLLWHASFASAALAFVVTLLCAATAARYHFWYFQVKNHKLGCTIKEWLNEKVSGDK